MTEPAPAPAPEPVLYHGGQPISREGAAARRTELTSNAEYMKAWASGDRAAVKELSDLKQLAEGIQPATQEGPPPPPPQNQEEIFMRAEERAAREHAMLSDALAREGFTPEQIHQVRGGRPITLEERQFHEQEIARMRRDRSFMQRWSGGDRAALHEMALHAAARGMPIGTLEEIQRWDAAHPMPQRA